MALSAKLNQTGKSAAAPVSDKGAQKGGSRGHASGSSALPPTAPQAPTASAAVLVTSFKGAANTAGAGTNPAPAAATAAAVQVTPGNGAANTTGGGTTTVLPAPAATAATALVTPGNGATSSTGDGTTLVLPPPAATAATALVTSGKGAAAGTTTVTPALAAITAAAQVTSGKGTAGGVATATAARVTSGKGSANTASHVAGARRGEGYSTSGSGSPSAAGDQRQENGGKFRPGQRKDQQRYGQRKIQTASQREKEGHTMYVGRLVRFWAEKGFGFIRCEEIYHLKRTDVFIHRSLLQQAWVGPGDLLAFFVDWTDQGPRASLPILRLEKFCSKDPTQLGVLRIKDGLGIIESTETRAFFGDGLRGEVEMDFDVAELLLSAMGQERCTVSFSLYLGNLGTPKAFGVAPFTQDTDPDLRPGDLSADFEFRAPKLSVLGLGDCPNDGASISKVSTADLTLLRGKWKDRQASGTVVQAWRILNPKMAWHYEIKRRSLLDSLGKEPDVIEGFHGTPNGNIFSIACAGFDSSRRAGQVFGAGEYFAKCPDVSKAYSRGGSFMFVCKLLLGKEGRPGTTNGDHIWVPDQLYYVVADPHQALPVYVLQFAEWKPNGSREIELKAVLTKEGGWSSIPEAASGNLPPRMDFSMSSEATNELWVSYLLPDLSDTIHEENLLIFFADLRSSIDKLRIVRGKFTTAKIRLKQAITRETVSSLNDRMYFEAGHQRQLTISDAHGAAGEECRRRTAGYCRGRNLRFVDPCWCKHDDPFQTLANFSLESVPLQSAKGEEIVSKFMLSAPFHDGNPRVVEINAIHNRALQDHFDFMRGNMMKKNSEDPRALELYHGTNNEILSTVYTHGLFPPSDMAASDLCPRSGGKGLSTSLCDNTCKFCIEQHHWAKCHMYGLGIYLADMAAKSHRYVSRAKGREHRMILCSVLSGRVLQLEAHLTSSECMHEVSRLGSMYPGECEQMVKAIDDKTMALSLSGNSVADHDLLFVKGLQHMHKPGLSVFNSEYLAFHPYQCLPRYEIVYINDL